jgi:hypothetical protein
MSSILTAGAAAAALSPAAYYLSRIASPDVRRDVLYAAAVAAAAFVTTVVTVPAVAPYFSRKGLKGKDMGRRGTPDEHKEMCVPGRADSLGRHAAPPPATRRHKHTCGSPEAPVPPTAPPPAATQAARLPSASCAAPSTSRSSS